MFLRRGTKTSAHALLGEKVTSKKADSASDEALLSPYEKFTNFLLPNGAYCFVIKDVGDVDEIRNETGLQIFYVIANRTITEKTYTNGKLDKSYKPRIFKSVKNIVGNAIIDVTEFADATSLPGIEEEYFFTLPKIPRLLVDKMDSFFRQVDAKYHSESIVVLTFDPSFLETTNPGDGWGIIVPDQKNNASRCRYEMDSVFESKPDDVVIVGTAHSHPHMSAFASHTDADDQEGFDGIHITFGWMPSKNNGATEYYIEMQIGGVRVKYEPQDVFELAEPPKFDVEDWISKVQKESYTAPPLVQKYPTTSGYSSGSHTGTTSGGPYSSTVWRDETKNPDAPDVYKNTVIVRLLDVTEDVCPVCQQNVGVNFATTRRCIRCRVFMILPGENLESLVKLRKEVLGEGYSPDLDPSHGSFYKPVVLWDRRRLDDGTVMMSTHVLIPGKTSPK